MAMILIEVDDQMAKVFAEASEEERRKIRLLLKLRLRELTSGSKSSLKEIMDRVGQRAQAEGLTPEALESMLNEQ